jgi:hypothetical protein
MWIVDRRIIYRVTVNEAYVEKKFKKQGASQNLILLLFSALMSGIIQGFLRSSVMVGWVLLFMPRYIPTDAHVVWYALVWGVYLATPFVLWKLFNQLDKVIDRHFKLERTK